MVPASSELGEKSIAQTIRPNGAGPRGMASGAVSGTVTYGKIVLL